MAHALCLHILLLENRITIFLCMEDLHGEICKYYIDFVSYYPIAFYCCCFFICAVQKETCTVKDWTV